MRKSKVLDPALPDPAQSRHYNIRSVLVPVDISRKHGLIGGPRVIVMVRCFVLQSGHPAGKPGLLLRLPETKSARELPSDAVAVLAVADE